MTGSMQRNKTFGSIGGGAPPSFMQHGGNSSTYIQNKLMRSKQQQAMQQPMGSNFAMKSSHPGNMDFTMNDENNMHPDIGGLETMRNLDQYLPGGDVRNPGVYSPQDQTNKGKAVGGLPPLSGNEEYDSNL